MLELVHLDLLLPCLLMLLLSLWLTRLLLSLPVIPTGDPLLPSLVDMTSIPGHFLVNFFG